MKFLKSVVFVLLILSTNAYAESNEPTNENSSSTHKFLLYESGALVWAWMASEYPKEFGTITALITAPLVSGDPTLNETTGWVSFAALEAISYYNITVDNDKISKKEIFINNFIAAHIWSGMLEISEYLIGDKSSKESLTFKPNLNGAKFAYKYNF